MFFSILFVLFYITIKHLNFNIKNSIFIVTVCSTSILLLLLKVFFDKITILSLCLYLAISCITFYIIFSHKKLIVFLLSLKSYYLFFVASLIVFSLCELMLQQNLYLIIKSKFLFSFAFFIVLLFYGAFEILLIKGLDKEKLEYLFTSINKIVPISMFVLLIGKNCSLLYILFFSRHAYLVTIVILASTLLEVYFGIFAVIAIIKGYDLSIYKHKNKILHMQYDLQISNLQQLEEYQCEIRRIAHDIHNHKTVLYNLIEEKDYHTALNYLQNYGNGFNHKKLEILTNHKILNALLLAKKESCTNNNIKLDLDINIPNTLSLSDFDLCIIIGNLMDNAIEASQKIVHTGNAYIKVKSSIINQNFIFDIQNNFDNSININNHKLLTTKKDKINHGLGLSNIQSTVDKYHGTCELTFEGDVFSSLIIIPLEDN